MSDTALLSSLEDIEIHFRTNGMVESAEAIFKSRQKISSTPVERVLPTASFLGSYSGYNLYRSEVSFDEEHYETIFPKDRTVVISLVETDDPSSISSKTITSLLEAVRNRDRFKNPDNVMLRLTSKIYWLMENDVQSPHIKLVIYRETVAFIFEDQGKAALFKLYFK